MKDKLKEIEKMILDKKNLTKELVKLVINKRATNIMQLVDYYASVMPNEISWIELTPDDTGAHQKREISWKELNEKSNQIAHKLIKEGTKPGDNIALLMSNSIEWIETMIGVLKTGAILAPLNPKISNIDDMMSILNSIQAKKIIVDESTIEMSLEMLHKYDNGQIILKNDGIENLQSIKSANINVIYMGSPNIDYSQLPKNIGTNIDLYNYSTQNPNIKINNENTAILFSTSGTTSLPKSVVQTHKNLILAMVREKLTVKQTQEDVYLCVPPLFHTGALVFWMGNLINGGKSVLLRSTNYQNIAKAIKDEQVSRVFLIRNWALDMMKMPKEKLDDLESLRLIHLGAQPIENEIPQKLHELLPKAQVVVHYGMTEAMGPGTLIKTGMGYTKGVGVKTKLLKINNDGTINYAEQITQKGEPGVLCIKGICIMKGYYKNEKATSETILPGGWLLTGDIFEQVDDTLRYVDRHKNLIIVSGENISPSGIENAIKTNEKLRKIINDIVVTGIKDDKKGEIVGAMVELKEGVEATEKEIIDIIKSEKVVIHSLARPSVVSIVDKIPINSTGKKDMVEIKRVLQNNYNKTQDKALTE